MKFLGKVTTGYYSLGFNILMLFVMIPILLGRVLYPKINEEIGKESSINTMEKYVLFPAKVLSIITPFIIGVVAMALPILYIIILPKYQPGLLSAQILIFGSFFICLIRSVVNFLIAINEHAKLLVFVCVSLMLSTGISLLLLKTGYGINESHWDKCGLLSWRCNL
jgi:O-antigen/teichoic acid export membrane protein